MDEFNLASRFANDEDEVPARGRGKIRRLRRKTGVGMEKPVDIEAPLSEDEELPGPEEKLGPDMDEEADLKLPNRRLGGAAEPALGFDSASDAIPPEEEDEAFDDLVSRMEGGSASAGRAAAKRAKLKGRRPAPRMREDEEE